MHNLGPKPTEKFLLPLAAGRDFKLQGENLIRIKLVFEPRTFWIIMLMDVTMCHGQKSETQMYNVYMQLDDARQR